MGQMDFALQVLLLGFSVVVFTLFLLYGVVSLFNRIFYRIKGIQPATDAAEQGKTAVRTAPGLAISPQAVAAVTAAVCRYMQTDASHPAKITIYGGGRKTGAAKSWAAAGRKALHKSSLEIERLRRRKGFREKV